MLVPLSHTLPQPPTLCSERLRLRAVCADDAQAVAELAGDRRVARQLADVPSPFPVDQAARWLEARADRWRRGGGPTFAITCPKLSPALVGTLSLRCIPRDHRAELGYWLGVPYWGHGLASEAVACALRWAFTETGLYRVYAQVITSNKRSHRVLLKSGLTHEGTRRGHLRKGRRFVDVDQYGILRDEWLLSHSILK